MTLPDVIVYGILALAVVLLLRAIVRGTFSASGPGGMAGLSAFHDLQPKDKQRAVEMIVDEKAGKRLEEQSSGSPPAPETPSVDERQKRNEQ